MNIITVVPVRSTSTRLPGKVLLPVLGAPMIYHFMDRVQRAKLPSCVVLATPGGNLHNFFPVLENKKACGFEQINIDESDVLSRLWHCAEAFGADLIVRANADNPCMDPEMIDYLLKEFLNSGQYDVLGTNLGDCPNTKWPQGLGAEVWPWRVLNKAYKELDDPVYREHPHKYFHDNGLYFEPACPFEWTPPQRFEVNDQNDLVFVRDVYNYFERNDFTTEELMGAMCREKR